MVNGIKPGRIILMERSVRFVHDGKDVIKMGQRARLMVFPLRQANKKPSWNTNRQKILKQKPGKDIRLKPRILN